MVASRADMRPTPPVYLPLDEEHPLLPRDAYPRIQQGGAGQVQEGAGRGITVNAVAPGYVDTEMVRAVPKDVLEKIVARIPVGRLGKAEDIARTVLFLVADDADFITGSTLSVNGGQHMY